MDGSARAHAHLWIVGGLATLWNAFGCFDYVVTQTGNLEMVGQFTDAQRAYFENFPTWSEAAWALGVWGALAGSLLLLARSRFAVAAFTVSILGLAGTSVYQFVVAELPAEFRTPGMIGIHLFIWVVAIALLLYAVRMRSRGVLR